ncbi:SPOR domain-containing protein [Canibacter oris]|uniref:SPOR domain-containing protein n=1 Tax=Canibacter oris TaxID=1365628 RepID=A0A840DN88_9MICO|nr:SPOR domain-containing protein [Canibacter oris]MBB4071527.1 hypothetical protein [Canibacter oris]
MSTENIIEDAEQYWYNTKTRKVEHGRLSPAVDRVGPFATAAEAAAAPQTLAARAAAWEAEDKAADEWED